MDYNNLLEESENNGLIVKEKELFSNDGRIKGNRIAIRKNLLSTEKKCTLAEELGHYYTSVGRIIDLNDMSNSKQEQKARLWGYNKLIGLRGLIDAYKAGCRCKYEIANFLDVTEDYLEDAIEKYTSKYGIYAVIDNFVVYFIPNLAVMELI